MFQISKSAGLTVMVAVIIMVFFVATVAHTQDEIQFFECSRIDFFDNACKNNLQENPTEEKQPEGKTEKSSSISLSYVSADELKKYINLFGTPIVNSRGEVMYSLPHPYVIKLAVNPTYENAIAVKRLYEQKARNLKRMFEVLDRVEAEDRPKIRVEDLEKVYFYFSPKCPYSQAATPMMNKLASLGIPVKGYTDASQSDIALYTAVYRPAFEIVRVSSGALTDSGVRFFPTIDWFVRDGGAFRTVGYRKYLLEDGTVDLRYEFRGERTTACGK